MTENKILNSESGNKSGALTCQEDGKNKVEIFKHDAVALKNSKYSSEDYTGILKIIHYKDADRYVIEWNIQKISVNNDDEWAMVEKHSKVDDPVRENFSSATSSGYEKKKHRHHRVGHHHRRHRHRGSSVESLNDLEKGNPQRPSQSLQIELYEIKSYRVSKKKNTVEIIQRTGAKDLFLFQYGAPDDLINIFRSLLKTKRAPGRRNLYNVFGRNDGPSFADLNLFEDEQPSAVVWKFLSNIQQRPLETTLSSFAKFNDYMLNTNRHTDPHRETEVAKVAEIVNRTIELDEDYTVIGKPIQLKPRPPVERGDPLSHEEWYECQDNDGRIKDPEKIKKIIFRGGVKPSLRVVWKYLLGLYPWESTRDEREEILKKKSQEYHRMKQQWQSISDDQENRWSDYSSRKSLIDKDVTRTDRELPFFQGESCRNLTILNDILMTYVMYNFDLGYVQGMSDLLSPILCTIQDEVETFWCFVGFMERTKHNFDLDQAGMKKQLGQVFQILSTIAPDIAQYLVTTEANNMFFCFRWLLVLFKREFSPDDIMNLWEVLWTDMPCPNFHILMCAAILDQEKSDIMVNELGFTEILKHVNELCRKLNLNSILCAAEGIYLQLLESKETLPTPVKRMLGFIPDETESSDCESDIDNTKYGGDDGAGKSQDLEQGKNKVTSEYSSDSEDD